MSKRELDAAGVLAHPMPDEELFDLLRDPAEACNVAADPAYAGVLAELRGRVDAWMKATEDPFLPPAASRPFTTVQPADLYDTSGPPLPAPDLPNGQRR